MPLGRPARNRLLVALAAITSILMVAITSSATGAAGETLRTRPITSEPVAAAAPLKPLSRSFGCKLARQFIVKDRRRQNTYGSYGSVVDWELTGCYSRDRYRVVAEWTYYYDTGTTCYDRGIVSRSASTYYWRQYAIDCN